MVKIQNTLMMLYGMQTGCSVLREALWRFVGVTKAHSSRVLQLCFRGHSNAISDCCFTSDGHYLCTASWDKSLKVWDIKPGEFQCHEPIFLNQGHEGSVSSCLFSQDGELS